MTRLLPLPLLALFAVSGCADQAAPAAATDAKPISPNEFASLKAEPDQKYADAYMAALKTISPELVAGKTRDAMVDLARDQCTTIEEFPGNEAKWLWWTNQRFTSAQHPKGFGEATAKKILATVQKYICPNY
ncbi:hypothetical protein [Paractinoplanes globisporus]|uniref:DUF732 domain-containing protein n=1 Tax=Paractinoplanes globisporus TaxID=113565 RepID=A0ABW6WB50_9ACTN|nr:hypothetical protein [Actinoplanes globisporus]